MAGFLSLAWLGRRLVGVWVMAGGLLLNLTVIVANGGLMPIAPETVQSVAGAEELARYELGQRLSGSKDVLLSKSDTRLQPLSDHILLPTQGWLPKVVSPGDLAVAIGVVLLVAHAIERCARASAGRVGGSRKRPLEKRAHP